MLAIQRFTGVSAVDAAFRLYRRHFAVLFGVSLVINVPVTLVSVAWTIGFDRINEVVERGAQDEILATVGAFVASALVGLVVMFVASMFGTAASTAVTHRAATAQPVELGDALRAGRRFFWPLFAASLVTTLIVSLGFLFLLIPGLVLMIGFAFVAPVMVCEEQTVFGAVERSWLLTRGRALKLVTSAAILMVITTTPSGMLTVLQLLPELRDDLVWKLGLTIATQALSALFTPLWYVTLVILYYDARVDLEAFDVQVLAQPRVAPATP